MQQHSSDPGDEQSTEDPEPRQHTLTRERRENRERQPPQQHTGSVGHLTVAPISSASRTVPRRSQLATA
jgi:hypothetical protein